MARRRENEPRPRQTGKTVCKEARRITLRKLVEEFLAKEMKKGYRLVGENCADFLTRLRYYLCTEEALRMYDNDVELLIRNPRAFESFLLAIAGKSLFDGETRDIPHWASLGENGFIIPTYSS